MFRHKNIIRSLAGQKNGHGTIRLPYLKMLLDLNRLPRSSPLCWELWFGLLDILAAADAYRLTLRYPSLARLIDERDIAM